MTGMLQLIINPSTQKGIQIHVPSALCAPLSTRCQKASNRSAKCPLRTSEHRMPQKGIDIMCQVPFVHLWAQDAKRHRIKVPSALGAPLSTRCPKKASNQSAKCPLRTSEHKKFQKASKCNAKCHLRPRGLNLKKGSSPFQTAGPKSDKEQ